jgi:hypothetical protein
MTIYQLGVDLKFKSLTLVNEADFDVLNALRESPAGAAWVPLDAEWIEEGRERALPKGDFPLLGTTPTFSRRAVDALLDVLVENGELLPVKVADEEYVVYNVTRRIDALDEERSKLVRFSDGGIMRVERYAFHREKLNQAIIFRVPQLRVPVFVTEAFVARVRDAGLTGFQFTEVWQG